MLKKIAIGLAVVIAAILGYAATKPNDFRVERSIEIKAPPDKIFALVNDLHHWHEWSPYDARDPNMKRSFSGAPSGVGAGYAWQGNNEVGEGQMLITASEPSSKIDIKLDFMKPFEGHNTAEYTFVPSADSTNATNSTKVTWALFGPAKFITKLMDTFFSMDNMIGKDFETGLANLKALAEK